MDEAALIRVAEIFVPELKPLAPDIVKAITTIEKAEAIVAPHFAGMQPGQQIGIFTLLPLIGELQPMMSDLMAIPPLIEKANAIREEYAKKIAAAETTKA
jgi:hypothetical protein